MLIGLRGQSIKCVDIFLLRNWPALCLATMACFLSAVKRKLLELRWVLRFLEHNVVVVFLLLKLLSMCQCSIQYPNIDQSTWPATTAGGGSLQTGFQLLLQCVDWRFEGNQVTHN